jgi:DNA-binding IscR family transcriptional regulator
LLRSAFLFNAPHQLGQRFLGQAVALHGSDRQRAHGRLPEAECRLRGLMLTLRDEMATMLDRISLADPLMVESPFAEPVQA